LLYVKFIISLWAIYLLQTLFNFESDVTVIMYDGLGTVVQKSVMVCFKAVSWHSCNWIKTRKNSKDDWCPCGKLDLSVPNTSLCHIVSWRKQREHSARYICDTTSALLL